MVCDLVDAKQTFQSAYKMTKYQQALVRPELKSLLSVPIFDQNKYDQTRPKTGNPLVGVLNFDSDDNLLADFAKPEVQRAAAECAKRMWQGLCAQG